MFPPPSLLTENNSLPKLSVQMILLGFTAGLSFRPSQQRSKQKSLPALEAISHHCSYVKWQPMPQGISNASQVATLAGLRARQTDYTIADEKH
jgi:hypothetical protein